uniref:Uncharacterized protein n=1 Tax=Cacopsylla melanoneura TaxID=428564 RepID=A0A8D9BXX9_9HEMI
MPVVYVLISLSFALLFLSSSPALSFCLPPFISLSSSLPPLLSLPLHLFLSLTRSCAQLTTQVQSITNEPLPLPTASSLRSFPSRDVQNAFEKPISNAKCKILFKNP